MYDNRLIKNIACLDLKLTILINVCIAVSVVYLIAEKVEADENTALRLAQCIRAECNDCDVNPNEQNAIAWVLKKGADRTGRTLLEQIKAYCAVFDSKNARAKAIWKSTFDKPKHGNKQWWTEAEIWANSFIVNPPTDPLPKADHWGGAMDTHRAKRANWKRIAGPPEYSNFFWSAYDND